MVPKRHRFVLERLEQRQLLTASVWFQDSGQPLSSNHDTVELGDLDGDGDSRCVSWVSKSCRSAVLCENGGLVE